jgi:hypothetical protein
MAECNIAYAHNEHHLYGLTNRVPGLVVIGRDDPRAERAASRAQSGEGSQIDIHSWDWLLRHAQRLAADSLHLSDFARAHTFSDDSDDFPTSSPRSASTPADRDEFDPWELELDDPF